MASYGTLKRQAKNYATCLGNSNFGDLSMPEKVVNKKGKYSCLKEEFPELTESAYKENNMRMKNVENKKIVHQSKEKNPAKKSNEEEDAIKGSFENVNEEKILQKISRINKLTSEINGRLQKILAKVSCH
jgi:hypothetical protein